MLKTEAETLRLGLVAGCATISDVVAWADDIITRDTTPVPVLCDLSLSARQPLDDVIGLLGTVPGQSAPYAGARALLQRFLARVRKTPADGPVVARAIARLAQAGELPEEEFGLEPGFLDDYFELEPKGALAPGVTALGALERFLVARSGAPEA